LEDLVFDVVIVFELSISDYPFCPTADNFTYGFDKVELVVWQSREYFLDQEHCQEQLVEIGSHDVYPTSLRQLEGFAVALGYKPK
jgi:hypothetical protein